MRRGRPRGRLGRHGLLALLLVLPVAACSGDDQDDGDGGGAEAAADCAPAAEPGGEVEYDPEAVLRYGSVPAGSLDPIRQVEANEIIVLQTIFEPLVKLNAQDELEPGLATEWSEVAPGVMELTLREGVEFQDGTLFNADAVAFNLDRARNSEESTIAGDLASVQEVEVVDDYTVRFQLDPPNLAVLPYILSDRAGLMASPAAVEAAGSSEAFSAAPVGAGPYQLQGEWFPRERVEVRAWDGYWNAEQRMLGGIDLVETASDASLNALQAGNLDIQYLDDNNVAAACEDEGLRVISTPTSEVRALLINQSMPPFDDLRVRQAIWHALDLEGLTEVLTGGRGEVARGWFPEGSPAYAPELGERYAYDPERARELLAEAGYPDGVEFTAEIGTTFTDYVRMGELIQSQLAAVGIDMELSLIDAGQVLARVYGTGSEGAAVEASPLGAPPIRHPSARFTDRFFDDGVYNPSGVEPPGLRDLVEAADATTDQAERASLLQEAAVLVADEVAAGIPLYFVSGNTGFADYVGGVQRGATRSNISFDGLYITEDRVPVDGS